MGEQSRCARRQAEYGTSIMVGRRCRCAGAGPAPRANCANLRNATHSHYPSYTNCRCVRVGLACVDGRGPQYSPYSTFPYETMNRYTIQGLKLSVVGTSPLYLLYVESPGVLFTLIINIYCMEFVENFTIYLTMKTKKPKKKCRIFFCS